MTQYDMMTKTRIPKLVSQLALPTVISMLVTAIYNMADTFFVGQLGDSPSAAVSVVFSLQTLIQAIGFTIGIGCGSMISRSLGKRQDENACIYSSTGIAMGLAFGTLLMIFGLLFNESIMNLLGATSTALPYAMQYAQWIFIAAPFMMMSFVMNNTIRSEGKARLSMIGIGIGSILNIGLDPLLINVFGMGVSGAGLATMISQIVSFMILISFFIFKKTATRLHIKYVSKNVKTYLEIIKCGSPTLFRQGFSTSSNIIINFLAKPYGDPLVAALGITNRIYLFVRNIIIGIGQGYQPILGFNYGAKKYDRIRQAFNFTLLLQTIVCLIATVVTLAFPSQLISFFRDSDEVRRIGIYSIRFLAISLPFLGFSTIVNQSLQIIGHSISASFLASCRQGIIYTPIVFILNVSLNWMGLCLSQPISDLLTALVTIPFFFYFFYILKKKKEVLEIEN